MPALTLKEERVVGRGFGEGGETEFDTFMEKESEDRSRLQSFKSDDPGSWDGTMGAVLVTKHCWTCFERSKALKKCSRCR